MSRTVVVTGSEGGLGAAICSAFAAASWNVVGWDLEGAHPLDVSDTDAVIRAAAGLEHVDAFVHAAGINPPTPLNVDRGTVEQILQVNLAAAFHCTQHLAAAMADSKDATVLFVSSVHAIATTPEHAVYAASKAGLEAMARGLALDLHADGIRVACVAPGAVDTPMLAPRQVPDAYVQQPEEVARFIRALVETPGMGTTGQTFRLDSGATAWLPTEFKR